MVFFVDLAQDDALAALSPQGGVEEAKHFLSTDAVALKSPASLTLPPVTMSTAYVAESGTEDEDSEARSSSEEFDPDSVFWKFSRALSCYPVVKQIAGYVDLNTLHALSRTCHLFREILLVSRNHLMKETLRCRFELFGAAELTVDPSRNGWAVMPAKHGCCARDMVAECYRCCTIVCRNCTMKPPSSTTLKYRLRRLCYTCLSAPLAAHFDSTPSTCQDSRIHYPTSIAFKQSPCTCNGEVWLCRPCGQILHSDDTAYRRVFTWRTRYSTYLGGGLGAGIGDTCHGVQCGRKDKCLAAEEIEVEIDCEVDDWVAEHAEYADQLNEEHVDCHHPDGEGPGYLRQEIMGVGGVVKHKVKKRRKIGAGVDELEEERESSKYLIRESSGEVRSWCGWCFRVVPSKHESS